jgi:CRP-like cAMP-binding protein
MIIVNKKYFKTFENIGTKLTLKANDMIFMAEDQAEDTYLIEEGSVRVYIDSKDGKEITLEVINAGRIFGDASFCKKAVRDVNIQATRDSVIIKVDPAKLFAVSHEDEELMTLLFEHITDSNRMLTHKIKALVYYNSKQKVADFLLENESHQEVHFTQQEISECLALNRVTVTRVIACFKEAGLVETHYHRIKVTDQKGLEDIIKGE